MNGKIRKVTTVEGVPAARASYSIFTTVGNLIFLAGQVAVDSTTGEVPEGFADQLRLILDNIKLILGSAGSSMDNILKTTVFLKDRAYHVEYDKIYQSYFKNGYPARSTVVAELMHEDFLVEIDAVALLPD